MNNAFLAFPEGHGELALAGTAFPSAQVFVQAIYRMMAKSACLSNPWTTTYHNHSESCWTHTGPTRCMCRCIANITL